MSFEAVEYLIEDKRIKKNTHFMILSDLHGNSYGQDNESLVKIIGYCEPDAVLMLGDMMSCRSKEAYYSTLGMCGSLTVDYPVYFVNGNHEEHYRKEKPDLYKTYMNKLRKKGVHILSNSSFFCKDRGICLYGLRLPLKSYVKFARYRLDRLDFDRIFEDIDKSYYNVLLSHNPYAVKGRNNRFDLVLSGHMHGGGVRIPGIGAVIGPNLFPFPRLTKGLYEENKVKLIVSAGLGDHFPMVRMNNPRTLISLRLVKSKEELDDGRAFSKT